MSLVTLEVLQGRTRLVVRLVQADQYFLLDLAARILRVNQLVQLVPVLLQKPGNLVVNSMRDILPVVRVHFCFNNCSRSSTLLCAFTKNCTWRARSAVLAPLAWFASSSLRSNFTTWSLWSRWARWSYLPAFASWSWRAGSTRLSGLSSLAGRGPAGTPGQRGEIGQQGPSGLQGQPGPAGPLGPTVHIFQIYPVRYQCPM